MSEQPVDNSVQRRTVPNNIMGGVNVRLRGQGGTWWSPSRDITATFPAAIKHVFATIDAAIDKTSPTYWQSVDEVAKQMNVSYEDLEKLAKGYGQLLMIARAGQFAENSTLPADFWTNPAQAVIGRMIMEYTANMYIDVYPHTVNDGQDLNAQSVEDAVNSLNSRSFKPTWRKKLKTLFAAFTGLWT